MKHYIEQREGRMTEREFRAVVETDSGEWRGEWQYTAKQARADVDAMVRAIDAHIDATACAHVAEYGEHGWVNDAPYAETMHCVECGQIEKVRV